MYVRGRSRTLGSRSWTDGVSKRYNPRTVHLLDSLSQSSLISICIMYISDLPLLGTKPKRASHHVQSHVNKLTLDPKF